MKKEIKFMLGALFISFVIDTGIAMGFMNENYLPAKLIGELPTLVLLLCLSYKYLKLSNE